MIKEEYKDLPDEEFVPIECFEYINKKFKGIYEMYWKACQYDDSGNLINTYTKKEIKDSNSLRLNAIRETCKNLGSTYHGYYWCFKKDQEELLGIINSTSKKPRNGYWNVKENCFKESLKYLGRYDFKKNSSGAYLAAKRNGWLDEFFPKTTPPLA